MRSKTRDHVPWKIPSRVLVSCLRNSVDYIHAVDLIPYRVVDQYDQYLDEDAENHTVFSIPQVC
jgi:hypothetical protein